MGGGVLKQTRLAFAAVLVMAAGAALAQQAPRGNAANGKALYESTGCYQCHGYVGQGGAAGPRLIPPLAYEPFELQLRMPRFVMPPYREAVLSAQQVADIYAFVLTFPKPPDPKTIPLLQ
jgi:mono/diheme cytochrome c family protein